MADGKVIIETDLDSKGFESSLGKLGSIAQKGSKVAVGAVAGVVTAVGGIATTSIKVGMDFESSMSQVAATMGITSSEIANGSESFELLKNAAKEAGSTTQFSASQSAEALNYLALAGYDAEKSVEALPKVLNLAAAGGLDLGYASDLVTDSMSALGLKTEELEGFVDKLAKTSQKSNTNVGQLGEGILTVGGTAKVLAGETTELNAALGILADNGIKGAEGGTALRNIILSLTAPTDKAARAMENLGLEVLDAEGNMRPLDAVFGDLNDNLSSMSKGEQTKVLNEIFNKVDLKSVNALLSGSVMNIEDLRTELSNMGVDVDSNADSLNYLAATFELNEDKTQFLDYAMQEMGITLEQAETLYDGLNKAVEEGGSRFDELSGYIDNADGAAANMAETMNDNLKGRMTQLGSALEGLGIEIYESMEQPLKTAAESAIDSVGQITKSITDGGLGDSFAKLGESIGKLIEKVSEVIADVLPKLIEGFSWILDNGDTIVSIIAGITGAIVAFKSVSVITGIVSAWQEATLQLALYEAGAGGATLAQGVLTGALTLGETIVGLLTGKITLATVAQKLWNLAMSANPIGLVVGLIAGLVTGLVVLWNTNEGFRNAVISAWNSIKASAEKCLGAICTFFTETIPDAFNKVLDFVKSNWQGLLLFIVNPFAGAFKLVYDNCEGFRTFIDNLVTNILDTFKEWGENLKIFFTETVPIFFTDLCTKISDTFKTWGDNIGNFFTNTIPTWIENITNWFNELPNRIGYAIGAVLANIVNWGVETYNYFSTNIPLWIESISTWFSELPGKIQEWFNQCIQNVIQWGTDTYNQAKEWVNKTIESVNQYFSELGDKIWNGLLDAINKIVKWGQDTYNKAKDYVNRTIDAVVKYFSELPNKVWTWLNRTIEKLVKWGDDMVKKAKQAAKETLDKIVDGFKNLPQKIANIGKSVVEGIWKGITGAGDWLWGKISGFAGNIVKGFKDNLKINSPSKIMRDKIGVGIVEGIEVGIDKEMPNLDDNVKNNMKSMTDKMISAVNRETFKVSSNISINSNKEFDAVADNNSSNTSVLNVNLNIDTFNNNNEQDPETFGKEIAFTIERQKKIHT